MKLLKFNYSIEYKKGKENRVVDALSRKDHSVSTISTAVPGWISDIEESYNNDTLYTDMIQQLVVNNQASQDYSLHACILRYKGEMCIGNSTNLKENILASLHSSPIGGAFMHKSNLSENQETLSLAKSEKSSWKFCEWMRSVPKS
jgi:hypothetical protein